MKERSAMEITVSLCMIVKNEEKVLARCLESVKDLVEEIIIVDTGSEDATKSIASSYTDKVYDFTWIDDFAAARNYSYSLATMDYILILDADDILLKEDAIKFKELKKSVNPAIDVVYMKYNVGFDASGKVTLSYYRERLSKRSKNFQWVDPIHEYLAVSGNTITVEISVTHNKLVPNTKGRNLRIFEKMVQEGRELSPRNQFYYARELFYNARYEEAIFYFKQFLDTNRGWLEDNISACFNLSKCYKFNGRQEERLQALIGSFKYDNPRAEICCEIGYYYKDKAMFEKAIFWFKLATQLEKPKEGWGFVLHDYWDYIPCIELCVCYSKVGDLKEAIKYNELAEKVKPYDSAVLHNKKYFKSILEDQNDKKRNGIHI